MIKPQPRAVELARDLIRFEAGGEATPEARADAAVRVLERLRIQLASLVGRVGTRALEARAIRLALEAHPSLRDPPGAPDRWSIDGARVRLASVPAVQSAAALESILCHLIDHLFTFVSEPLTVHLLQLYWPGFAVRAPSEGAQETQ
jgi:hypothetical protein